MKRLFGTDGIRAVAGEHPLDQATVRRFGAALAEILREEGQGQGPARVALGRDTRKSGPWLRDAVAAGLVAHGVSAVDVGVITTPGLAYVLRDAGFQAGVMISASHNPYQDNGLKAFDGSGVKLSDELEQRLEELMLDRPMPDPGEQPDAVEEDKGLLQRYVRLLSGLLPANRFDGMRVLLDCANGSASAIAPQIFRDYGAEVECVGNAPDGTNINRGCGSLHVDGLAEGVRAGGFDVALAFDGDADRCLAVSADGRLVDGDHILYIVGRSLKRRGRLRGNGVVATVMSNFWLEELLGCEGISLHRAPVGDKYVLERMLGEGVVLGGEQSGHVIFLDHASTGDGILTGLLLLDALLGSDRSLGEILEGIVPYPQVLLNVRVREKPDLRAHAEIGPVLAEIEQALHGAGRVVLRYSGTEPLARVMVEGKDAKDVRLHAERLAGLLQATIGS